MGLYCPYVMSETKSFPINEGMCGNDNGHDFRVINERIGEVQIEYVEDGKQAWFSRGRFEVDETGEVQLR